MRVEEGGGSECRPVVGRIGVKVESRKARVLQRMLVRSQSEKALSVRRVTENQGKRTAGVDGETWPTPEAKSKAVLSLTDANERRS